MKKGKMVFCVEDNPEIAAIIGFQLKGLGYQVCGIADNARDAMDGIGQNRPDIVLVDIGLNGKPEGLEIGNFLGSETNIPFIYLSGQDDPEILEHARKTEPDGYLTKPFDKIELKAALETAQNRCQV